MILIQASLGHFSVGLETQDCIDFASGDKELDIDFVEGVRTRDDVLEPPSFMQLIEEKALEESTISLGDHSINNVYVILYLPMVRRRKFRITYLTLVMLWIAKI